MCHFVEQKTARKKEVRCFLYFGISCVYNTHANKLAKLSAVTQMTARNNQREVEKMRKYEIVYILKADLDEEARKAENEKLAKIITDNGGTVNKTDETLLGLRDLAYPIKKETKGYYVVLKVTMDNTAYNEFNRLVRINGNVLRHLITVDNE